MTKEIKSVVGKIVHLNQSDIDTDQIIPARFLKQISFDQLGEQLFYDQRFQSDGSLISHPLNQKPHPDILLSNENFGCGSSREHAPQSLVRYGIRCIIALSFGPIFRTNCQQIGLPCFEIEKGSHLTIAEDIEKSPEAHATIDVITSKITLNGRTFDLSIPKQWQQELIQGAFDPLDGLLSHVAEFQKIHSKSQRPVLD